MKPLIIDSEITLIPYYPNYDTALPWYQDLDVCRQVDNIDCTIPLNGCKKCIHFSVPTETASISSIRELLSAMSLSAMIRKYALLYAKTFKISGLEDAVS